MWKTSRSFNLSLLPLLKPSSVRLRALSCGWCQYTASCTCQSPLLSYHHFTPNLTLQGSMRKATLQSDKAYTVRTMEELSTKIDLNEKPPTTLLAHLPATYSGSRKDGILSGFHYYLMDWCARTLGGLILVKLFTDARHCGLRAVL